MPKERTPNRDTTETEVVPLYRGGAVVSSLLGSFGVSLRETRLTAMLGYVISLAPDSFAELLGFEGEISSVTLEANHQQDRSDIFIETTKGLGIVEAKRTPTDPLNQAFKYRADWRVLLTDYAAAGEQKRLGGVKYLRWQQVADVLESISATPNQRLRFICRDLLKYLEDHNMIRRTDSVEIYAREINNEESLNLFLKARLYRCKYQASSRLPEALYFAPHFGWSIADAHPGVKQGISYIACIEAVEVTDSWGELLSIVRSIRGKTWLNGHIGYIEESLRRRSKGHKRSILFLGEPRLVFNPPVRKENLQKGRGWLSKRTFSFDELFAAWSR